MIVTCSLYVPGVTTMVSPGPAAATAAEMVALQPNFPPGLTHRVAAVAKLQAPNRDSSPRLIARRTDLSRISP